MMRTTTLVRIRWSCQACSSSTSTDTKGTDGSFNRRDSDQTSDLPGIDHDLQRDSMGEAGSDNDLLLGFNAVAPSTPSSGASSPVRDVNEYSQSVPEHDLDDEELESGEQGDASHKVEPKKGGYASRIEQILYEHPDLDIQIVYAGKNTEGGGSYITYTIRTGVCL